MNKLDLRSEYIGGRNAVLDNVRGLFILLFIFWHTIFEMKNKTFGLPQFLKHAYTKGAVAIPSWGFNLVDLAPIVFIFFIGLIIYPNIDGKIQKSIASGGTGKGVLKQHLIKYLALQGLFMTLLFLANSFQNGLNPNPDYYFAYLDGWSYMCDVAITAVFITPFLTKPFRESTLAKFIAGVVLLVLYGLLRVWLLAFLGTKNHGTGGGVGACVGYTSIVLITAGIAELARKKNLYFYISAAVLYLLGLFATMVLLPRAKFPENLAASAVFSELWMLGALSKVFVIYLGLWAFFHFVCKDKPVWGISTVGRNLLLYMLVAVIIISIIEFFPPKKPVTVAQALTYTSLIILFCLSLTVPLSKYKITAKF